MADPMAHIKDAYYFEVPKFLWRPKYMSLEEVPPFLRAAYPDASLEEFDEAMAGKILIPQPFGAELEYLDKKKSGFAISKFMVMEVVAALLLIAIFVPLARRVQRDVVPRGRLWNLFETFLVFIRDQVARPAIGKHDAETFLPLLWTIFFFILACNLLGLVPWAGSATGALATTGTLAAITFATVIVSGMIKLGPAGFWKAQVPHGVPLLLIPLIFPIEVLGLMIKHVILAVRLLANMMAGHLVLAVVVGFITATAGTYAFWGVMPASILGATALSLLELFVAFLQAYIFTFLSALFIGMAVHPH